MAAFGHANVAARLALAGRFDLDHLGAMIGHHERELRAGQKLREVNDPYALELQVIPVARSEPISSSE